MVFSLDWYGVVLCLRKIYFFYAYAFLVEHVLHVLLWSIIFCMHSVLFPGIYYVSAASCIGAVNQCHY